MQRDLTDSTVLRNMGVAFGYAVLAYDSCLRGLGSWRPTRPALPPTSMPAGKCSPSRSRPSCAATPCPTPTSSSRSSPAARASPKALQQFIATLAIPEAEKARLLQMTPASYIGKAAELAKRI